MADMSTNTNTTNTTNTNTNALLKWLDTDAGILARIEVLVVFSGALMTFLALFGSYRRRSRSSAIKYSLWAAYTLTDSISAYSIGLMQTAKFRNQLFVLWASFLVIVRCSTHSIAAFSIQDKNNWVSNLLHIMLLVLYSGIIYNSYFLPKGFWIPVEIFWLVCMIKILETVSVFTLVWRPNPPMMNTKLVSDYMHYEHELSNEDDEVDPARMKGYKYLVSGEEERDVKIGPPDYLMKLMLEDAAVASEVVTVEKIWGCPGRVLNNSEAAKDVCLAFALFKLLRRRFTGHPWAEAKLLKSKKLILEGLFRDHKRAFSVIETELAFLYDSFYTKYVVVSVRPWMLLSSVATLVGSFWVAVVLAQYKPPSGEEHLSGSVDILVTIFFLVVVTFVEVWQIIIYVFSDWAKVLLLCNYVRKANWQEMDLFQTLLSFVCRQRVLKPWDGKLGQYSLLDSYEYEPSRLKALVLGTQIGQKASPHIQLPGEVKEAIVQSMIASGGKLRNMGEFSLTLCGVGIGHELSWACKSETYAQIILVWHVATSICFGKTSPDPTSNEDQFNHKVADSLSKYCAYLVVFCQEFLPDQNSVTEVIFARIINETRAILEGQRSMRNKLNRLTEVGDAPETIVEKGGKLGKQLMYLVGDKSLRLTLLREIWVEIILYIAPSDNTTVHAQHLAEGGEFITHLWTLLCHVGIFERPTMTEPF